MIDNVSQIKLMRKKLNITQKELSQQAGVSQSLIAKIESGNLDPAYSKFKQIMNTLQALTNKDDKKARDVMIKQIIKLSPKSPLKTTINKMKKYNISQLPVFENHQVVGLISEHYILDALTKGYPMSSPIESVMGEAPPTLSGEANLQLITQILKEFPLLIVSENGKAKGIITKADLFNTIK